MLLKTLHFASLDSTMSWAKAHATELDPDALTRITASEQTAGRGQFGKSWHSPPGNLYASFCFRVPLGWPDLPHAAQVLALSAAQLLEDYGLVPKLKWPNDLLIGSKKVGGVLCETEKLRDQMLLIDGIGLNITLSQAECAKLDQPVTSLVLEGLNKSVEEVLEGLTKRFLNDVEQFLKEGFEPFKGGFEKRLTGPSQ